MYGAIEAGGTKFVCAVSNQSLKIVDKVSIPTTTPNETITAVYDFFDQYELNAIGIGSFGPIDVNEKSETYGYITLTPKKEWSHYNFVGSVKERYPNTLVAWTTDVNAAAFGEYKQGSATRNSSCLYLTVGTGVGGGAIIDGKIVEGYSHPEMGHLLVRMHHKDSYKGHCPFHGNCLEGLASGPAIRARYGIEGRQIEAEHEVWEMIAYYLAQAVMSYTFVLRPEKIILGGGVMKQKQLLPLIRSNFQSLMNGYIEIPNLNEFITPPALGDDAGIIGCLLLAKESREDTFAE